MLAQTAPNAPLFLLIISALVFGAVYLFARHGWRDALRWYHVLEYRYDRVLNQQLLMGVSPRSAMILTLAVMGLCMLMPYLWFGDLVTPVLGLAVSLSFPSLVLRHLEQKRRERLDRQLVDGIMTLASGVRAGLTLVQSMELLVTNFEGPVKQEFAQLLREYQMGTDLNQAMRNTANRIGSSNYRLLFTAIEMHRLRGGDSGESLDRIAESIREIQRLEGKLDAITSQGRAQASMMAITPFVIMGMYYLIDSEGVTSLFTHAVGRVVLLLAVLMVLGGFLWIRRIMAIDI